MRATTMWMVLVLLVLSSGAVAVSGCGDDGPKGGGDDLGMVVRPDMTSSGGDDLGAPDLLPACAANPMTHVEILNACTNAQAYDKMPFYPAKAPNGVLPPLP